MSTPAAGEQTGDVSGEELERLRAKVLQRIQQKGLRHFDEPVQLASGKLSRDFIDGKVALSHGADLADACRAMMGLAHRHGAAFDAVGGLTMGADQFAHGIAVLGSCEWFSVRKEAKQRGTGQLVEGCALRPDQRVLLVDDVVSEGGSIRKAHEAVVETGASIVFVTTLVDRGHAAPAYFSDQGVAYEALLTYRDVGIDPL